MVNGETKEYVVFDVVYFRNLNKYLQTQVLLLQRLVKQYTALYKQTTTIASIRIFNEHYEEIQIQLKKLKSKILLHLQEQSKELKLKAEQCLNPGKINIIKIV